VVLGCIHRKSWGNNVGGDEEEKEYTYGVMPSFNWREFDFGNEEPHINVYLLEADPANQKVEDMGLDDTDITDPAVRIHM